MTHEIDWALAFATLIYIAFMGAALYYSAILSRLGISFFHRLLVAEAAVMAIYLTASVAAFHRAWFLPPEPIDPVSFSVRGLIIIVFPMVGAISFLYLGKATARDFRVRLGQLGEEEKQKEKKEGS